MRILFILLFLCTSQISFAAAFVSLPPEDTTVQKKPYELNQNEFLEKYGRDDSSRALIGLFFHKRNIGVPNSAIGVPLLIAGGIGLGVVGHKIDKGEGDWDLLGQLFLFTLVLGAGVALFSTGMTFLGKYSRKKLFKLLNSYFAGKSLPRGIAKNKTFRKLVAAEHR